MQSMPDASPTKWHLAHTSWFFETFVLEGAPLEPAFDYLFNSYYEAVGPRHPRAARGLLSRPSLDEVRGYRRRIDERMLEALERGLRDEVRARVVLGLEHEQQHQELILTDIKHLLGGHPGAPAYRRSPAAPARSAGVPPPEKQQSQTAPPARSDWRLRGEVRERARARLDRAARGRDGDRRRRPGRERRAVRVRQREPETPGVAAPACARVTPGHLRRIPRLHQRRGLSPPGAVAVGRVGRGGGRAPRPPAVLARRGDLHSRRRAAADRRRAGRARQLLRGGRVRPLGGGAPADGDGVGGGGGGRAGARRRQPRRHAVLPSRGPCRGRVGPLPRPGSGDGKAGLRQVFGDVWEWTASAYAPYPGYRAAPGALGEYNGKFMCSQLVLRGGSCATPRTHIRPSYRNFFPPGARWQFSGIRLARDA